MANVVQVRRNLHQLLGLPFPLGPLGLSFPLGLLGPRSQVSQLLSHPLVLGLQHFNPYVSVIQRQLSYAWIIVRTVKRDKPGVHRPAAVKGTAVRIWPGLRSGSVPGSGRGWEQSWCQRLLCRVPLLAPDKLIFFLTSWSHFFSRAFLH